jgi:DNA polymerase
VPAFPDADRRHPIEPGCTACPDLVDSRECIAWGNGPLDADLVVVGEAPAAGDPDADRWRGGNRTGLAYTSRHSGRRIRDLLADAGFGPERTYVTNAVKCFPSDGEGGNREPTADELANCRSHLREEIATVEPRAIVPTGRHATASVLAFDDVALDGFLERVLEPVESDALGTTVVPLLHPSYQDVWIGRLGFSAGGYLAAVADVLEAVTDGR